MKQHSKAYYNNINEVLEALNNSNIDYLVLRNYDNLLEDEIYMDGHGDIDLLCADSRKLASALHAIDHPGHIKNGEGNGTHYFIFINNVQVSLDLRHIGDGYYCEKWERDLLDRRRKHEGFYVLSTDDYFYSLIYHAIFQKHTFSKEYQQRLQKMAEKLGIETKNYSLSFFVNLLESHMKKHGYHYEYPKDKHVPLKREHIQDKSLFVMHSSRYWEHLIFETKVNAMALLVKIYHKTIKRK